MDKINQTDAFAEITKNQKSIWSKGDFNEIARQNVVIAEALCRAVDPQPGQVVLDLACGSGTAALVAARRYCHVIGIDYVPELIERARNRAESTGLKADFHIVDAQNLPFPDNSFDVVLSVYGVQFVPDQEKAANEMLRVCRPGGRIGLAGPVSDGWSEDFFATHAKYVPPQSCVNPPSHWGSEFGLSDLLGKGSKLVRGERKKALQYYLSEEHAVEVFSRWFGPTLQALQKLDADQQKNLLDDLKKVFSRYNRSKNNTAIIENTYFQSVSVVKD